MKSSTRLLLLRHGEVEERYQRVFGGRIDMDLSMRGREQAEALGAYLRGRTVHAVYASPMRRAQQTLAPVAAALAAAPVTRTELREVDFGVWTGLSWQGVYDRFGVHAFDWLKELERDAVPEAEGDGRFRSRVEPFVREVLERHAGECVAMVCHGGVIRMVLSILLELPLHKTSAFEIDYASLTAVDWQPGRVEIRVLNLVPWQPNQP
jgi:broad specificity phosphatase PhoE